MIDSWKAPEAIDRHHASPMMERIAELREKYDPHMRVERYLSDEERISEKDRAYISKIAGRNKSVKFCESHK